MKPEFFEIIPQYPLPIPIYKKEDYYSWPVKMMKEKGYITKIVTINKNNQKENEIVDGIEIIRFSNVIKLYSYVFNKRKALFFAQGKIFPLFTGFFAKKSIYISHATMGKDLPKYLSNPLFKFIYKLSLSKFKKVITISPYETVLLTKFGFKNNLIYVPNAIDCEFFSNPHGGEEFNKKYYLTRKSKKIVFLGNMHQRDKTNIKILFKAVKIILQKLPDTKLIIIGKFPEKVKKFKEFLPIANSVVFTGWLPHTEFIKAFDVANVFVNTSLYEGNPLSVGEAVSAKIPVCLSDIPTLRSIYRDTVLYHSPCDYKKLAVNIITSFERDKSTSERVGKAYNIIKSSCIIKVKSIMKKVLDNPSTQSNNPLKTEWKAHWHRSSIEYSIKQIDYEDFFRNSFNKLFKRGDKVLEAGCGFGRYCFWLEKRGIEAVGIDIIKEAIDVGNKFAKSNKYKSNLLVGNVCKLPFADNSFDGYISLGVVEHFRTKKEVQNAFTEAYRVLKPGGKAFFVVPNPIAIHMLLERLINVIGFRTGLAHYPVFKKNLLYYGDNANFLTVDAGIHDFYFPVYSIVTLVLRRDVWLLKYILKKILNVCDNIPFLREFGSGIHVVVQKPYNH